MFHLLDRKVLSSQGFDYFLLKIFFYNLLAVIYDKKFLTRIRISVYLRSQMYHIIKDVASLITM